ncbi:unnamed protein product [Onchocerca flexuosa]|uniref:Secreted protein n=1 Tax=Onchocerca flexuosa TaxID=387005 RepID=A0A183HY28_9BILA|nr:unnamed protein product [Onchocerca flexuosa]
MRRITLLFTIIYTVSAQMTFTDNWDKRALPNLFRGWQQDDLQRRKIENNFRTINEACSWNIIAEVIRELKQIYKRQNELINLIGRCNVLEHPVFVKEG